MRHCVIIATLCACGPRPTPAGDAAVDAPADDVACAVGGASLAVGGGTGPTLSGYRALANGDTVHLTPGPQGGQHIWIGLRGRGFDLTQPLVTMRAFHRDGSVIGQLRVRLRFSLLPDDPSASGLPAQTLIIDDDKYCAVLHDTVRVVVDVDDGAGRCLREERTLRIDGIDPQALEIDRAARLNCCASFLRRCFPNGPPPDASLPDASMDAAGDQ